MERFFPYKLKVAVAFLLAIWGAQMVNSQSIDRPRSKTSASKFCASKSPTSNNSIFVIESGFTANTFSSSNVFSLLLSDVDGLFNNPTVVGTSGTDNTTLTLEFSVDFSQFIEPFKGSDNYKLRIISSELPDLSPSQSLTIPIFYVETPPVLESNPRFLCDSGVIFATPDDFDEYIWYKADLDGSNVTLIPGESSNTINVNEVGRYYYVIDIGECNESATASAVATSNFTEVFLGGGVDVSIAGATTRTGCSDESILLESSTNDASLSYRWYKGNEELEDGASDSIIISGSDTSTLTVSGIGMEGEYRLAASNGSITDCTSQSDPVQIELLNPKISIVSETTVLLLPPGEPKTLTAQLIRGDNPVYTWFKDSVAQPDSNSLTYEVTEAGTYYVQLEATSPCPQDNTVISAEQVEVVPAENLSITIAYTDPNYEDCELDQTILEVSEVSATVNGDQVVLDQSALQSLVVDWQKDNISTGETAQTILIDSASDNGVYTAVIGDSASDPLTVILGLDSFEITTTPENLPLDGEIELSLGLDDTTGYTFQWFRNLTEEIPNSNSEFIDVTEPGQYSVQVFFSTCGAETVGPIIITTGSPVIPSVITPNGDGINDDWVLPADFSQLENVEVNVYASNGELDYSTTNYNAEWPQESKSKAVGTVYYYVINVDNNPVEQGSITIIR